MSRPQLQALEDRRLLSGSVSTTTTSTGAGAFDVRSIDGTGNNLAHPDWGSAGVDLLRIAPAAYADGVSTPAGADRPSARVDQQRASPTRATRTSSATGNCRR